MTNPNLGGSMTLPNLMLVLFDLAVIFHDAAALWR